MPGRLTVVGLGPAGPDLVVPATRAVLEAHSRRFLRTRRHPAASVVTDAVSFDDVYESEPTFAAVYETISERLIAAAAEGDVVYAVPGSPLVLERSVELLRRQAAVGRCELVLVAAMSFLDLAWARLGVDPVEEGVRLVDGHRFATSAAGQPGPLLVAHCHDRRVLSDIKLAVDDQLDRGPDRVVVLQRLGLADESVIELRWPDLDRSFDPDHLTTLYIPELAEPVAAEMTRFDELVRLLRSECPWDREQTHASLRRHLLEEAHETLEALDARADLDDDEPRTELDEHLAEELGDLLYQIYFHARLAAERGAFTVADVARGVHDKLVARHPHVFGDVVAEDARTVLRNWEAIKREEKGRGSAMDGLPAGLPALLLALKIQKRAAGAGLDREGGPEVAYADLSEELTGVEADPSEHEVGDLLFAAVQVARRLGHDPESALRTASTRFERRFREVERLARLVGLELASASEAELDALWTRAELAVG
ncbi:MAG: nucleoside triphosphate pyrophosphohydrolase [Acidimicrobiales bacterium]